jgi:hypothetical protein
VTDKSKGKEDVRTSMEAVEALALVGGHVDEELLLRNTRRRAG